MSYVITCGDEGVQINEGTRLGVVGSGFKLDGFSPVVKAMKKVFGEAIAIAASEENDWIKKQLDLKNWEQVNASAQQHVEAVADAEGLLYAGYLPFADPRQLKHEVKGHMVRPHKVHIANTLSFTCGGGEQTYHLGRFVISADWIAESDEKVVKKVLKAQVDFYQQLIGDTKLQREVELDGELGSEVAEKNKAILVKLGFIK
ncbi:MAG: hypothetical protein WDZ94_01680 [Patescibacteria group bacterium]